MHVLKYSWHKNQIFTPTPKKKIHMNKLMHKFHKEKLCHVDKMYVITMPQNTSIFHIFHFLGMFTQDCWSPVAEKTVLVMWKHNLYQHTKVQKHRWQERVCICGVWFCWSCKAGMSGDTIKKISVIYYYLLGRGWTVI